MVVNYKREASMKTRKILAYIFIQFLLILQSASAYQELHEPDIVYIEYKLERGVSNAIGIYESAANTLMLNVGETCFQKIDSSERNKRYLLLKEKKCNGNDTLFHKVLEFYEQVINASSDEDAMDDKITITRTIKVKEGDKWLLKSLSITVNKSKKIITELLL